MKLYINDLGFKDPIIDFVQIEWFLNHLRNKSKRKYTKLLLDIYESSIDRLINNESYELIGYLDNNLSTKQIASRFKYREKSDKENAIKQKRILRIHNAIKFKKSLLSGINYN